MALNNLQRLICNLTKKPNLFDTIYQSGIMVINWYFQYPELQTSCLTTRCSLVSYLGHIYLVGEGMSYPSGRGCRTPLQWIQSAHTVEVEILSKHILRSNLFFTICYKLPGQRLFCFMVFIFFFSRAF